MDTPLWLFLFLHFVCQQTLPVIPYHTMSAAVSHFLSHESKVNWLTQASTQRISVQIHKERIQDTKTNINGIPGGTLHGPIKSSSAQLYANYDRFQPSSHIVYLIVRGLADNFEMFTEKRFLSLLYLMKSNQVSDQRPFSRKITLIFFMSLGIQQFMRTQQFNKINKN